MSHLGYGLPSFGRGPQGALQPDCRMTNMGVALEILGLGLHAGSKAEFSEWPEGTNAQITACGGTANSTHEAPCSY